MAVSKKSAPKKSTSKKVATGENPAKKAAAKKVAEKKLSTEERFQTVLSTADRLKGDKDPVVIAWCRDNLTPEEFEAKYKGRRFQEEA